MWTNVSSANNILLENQRKNLPLQLRGPCKIASALHLQRINFNMYIMLELIQIEPLQFLLIRMEQDVC